MKIRFQLGFKGKRPPQKIRTGLRTVTCMLARLSTRTIYQIFRTWGFVKKTTTDEQKIHIQCNMM